MVDNFFRLSKYLGNEKVKKTTLGYATGRQRVPLQPNFSIVGEKTNEPFVVYNVSYLKDKPFYVSGYLNKPTKKPMAFVAKVDSSKVIEWTREVGTVGAQNGDYARLVSGFDGGCVAVVSSSLGELNANNFVRVDSKSGVQFKKPLQDSLVPYFLQYDEITQNALLGFGKPVDSVDNVFGFTDIVMVDSLGNDVWKTTIPAKGSLVDVVKSGDKFLAFVNYQSYINENSQNVINASNSFGHIMAIINSADGSLEKLVPIKSESSYTISKVFSISSSEINLIGQVQDGSDDKLIYIIISNKGEVIYSNFGIK
jgi:hypothetical protein